MYLRLGTSALEDGKSRNKLKPLCAFSKLVFEGKWCPHQLNSLFYETLRKKQ